ncbi:hypothetical protein E3P94_00041 [Wallemia ichthyophaga]|nr:hypothetical protein E3P95_00041 [Wallemia ichthyophaga]TIB06027.1 hypothetical protein E3P94_00041 [Wallemia ichthyophaga]
MAPYTRPETVLKRAEELVAVNQHTAALQSLQEMFTSKRFRSTPLSSLEPIMLRFVELCVTLRKTRSAKDGLLQYKNISQNFSVQSIELVLNRFLHLSEEKVIDAKRTVDLLHPEPQDSAVAVDDLEAAETPESILMSAVSSDQNRDRTERAVVTPWLKYLWDAYRTALDTLRNNARLEILYQQIANEAFKFCLQYSRKTEFRRLCELLRSHVANVSKYAHQAHSINLTDTETLQRHLDTRFAQLSAAVDLELWQEAFRSVEDIHNLLVIAKKAPKSSIMAEYYEKLTRIFLVADNRLFHAAAFSRYYGLAQFTVANDAEHTKLSDYVLLSALAVPVHISSTEDAVRANQKLSSILSLQKIPTRSSLLTDAIANGVLKRASKDVRQLYQLLEADFHPLNVCETVAPLLASIGKDESTSKYIEPLQNVVLTRLFEQLAQLYDTVDISYALNLVKPLGRNSEKEVERFVIGSVAIGGLKVRIDHVKKSIAFQEDIFAHSRASEVAVEETSKVQPTPADLVRYQYAHLSDVLQNTLYRIDGTSLQKAQKTEEDAYAHALASMEEERKGYLYRRAIITRRRELADEHSARREKEDSEARSQRAKVAAAEQTKREHEDGIRKEQERRRREMESIRIDEAKKLAQNLAEKSGLKVNVNNPEELDTDKLVALQVEHHKKEQNQMSEKLRVMYKRMDHLERAFRREEKPLLVKDFEEQQKADRELYDVKSNETKKVSRETFEQNLATKNRLQRIQPAYAAFRADVETKAGERHKELERQANEAISAEIAERQAKVAEQKRLAQEHADAQRALTEAQEAERAQAEEVERKKRDALMADKERSEAEANERRAERDAERKKTEEIVRKQNEREEAALKKQRETTFQKTGSVWGSRTPGSESSGASTPSTGGPPAGSWMARRRQAEAEGKLSKPASSTPPPPPPGNPAARSSRAPQGAQEKPSAFGSMRKPDSARSGGGAPPPPNPQRSRW